MVNLEISDEQSLSALDALKMWKEVLTVFGPKEPQFPDVGSTFNIEGDEALYVVKSCEYGQK